MFEDLVRSKADKHFASKTSNGSIAGVWPVDMQDWGQLLLPCPFNGLLESTAGCVKISDANPRSDCVVSEPALDGSFPRKIEPLHSLDPRRHVGDRYDGVAGIEGAWVLVGSAGFALLPDLVKIPVSTVWAFPETRRNT
jgi:hypothetical protein